MKTDRAVRKSDKIEAALQKRIDRFYADALSDCLKQQKEMFDRIAKLDIDYEKRLAAGEDEKKLNRWRAVEAKKIFREQKTERIIMNAMKDAGKQASRSIEKSMSDIYTLNREEVVREVDGMGYGVSFEQFDAKQIRIILDDEQGVGSKAAFNRLESGKNILSRVRSELALAAVRGESKEKLTSRIQDVTGSARYQARRIAQTERTRVQSQSRADAISEAVELGVNIENEWSTNMDGRARESHEELNGKRVPAGEDFLPNLAFPGDPRAPAGEVINCRCVLVPRVLPPKKKEKPEEKQTEQTKTETKKPSFVPAATIEEAEEYAQRFVSEHKNKFYGNVSYKGIDVSVANEINRTLTKLYEENNLPRLDNIKPMNFREKIWKGAENALFAYRDMGKGELYFNPKINKNFKAIEKYYQESKDAMKYLRENYDKLKPDMKKIFDMYEDAGRGLVADSQESTEGKIKAGIDHEMGHFVYGQILWKQKEEVKYVKDYMDEFAPGISGYAQQKFGEYIAESYCAYQNGEDELIDPNLATMFRRLKR